MPNLTVSANVDSMLSAADNAAIRSAIGVGTTDIPAFAGLSTTGNAGIGTATPASGLHVSGALGTNVITYDSAAALKLTNTTGGSWLVTSGVIGVANAHFSIRQEGVAQPAIVVTAIGNNVGIGLNTPTAKLDISDTTLSGSGSLAGSALNIAQTWNTTGTPTAIKLNVTDTTSNAASKLMDLQVGGVSVFNVNKAGSITIGTNGGPFTISAAGNLLQFTSNHDISFTGLYVGRNASTGLVIGYGANIVSLHGDAAGVLAQRNGTNKQTLRIYNTYTSATVYERAVMDWNGPTPGNLQIGTEFLGSGSGMAACPIDFVVGGVVRLTIATSGNATLTGGLTIGASAALSHSGRVLFSAPSVGVYLLQNNTQNDFNRIQLGGTTNLFPAIKRNGTGIDIRLADDSAFAPLSASNIVASGYFSTSGYCIVGSNNGYFWPAKGGMYAPSDGVMRLSNDSVNGFTRLELGTANLGISRGTGSPEGVVTALVGSLYLRTDGGVLSTFYVKESGTGNTGWVAK